MADGDWSFFSQSSKFLMFEEALRKDNSFSRISTWEPQSSPVEGPSSSRILPTHMNPTDSGSEESSDSEYEGPMLILPRPIEAERGHALRLLSPEVTTLMVRNVPAKFTQHRLAKAWQVLERPELGIDMLYAPTSLQDRRAPSGKGFCFINFVSHEKAAAFQLNNQGGCFANHGRCKPLDFSAAKAQGLVDNLLQFLDSSGKTSRRKRHQLPLIYSNGQRVNSEQAIFELTQEFGLVMSL